MQTFQQLKKLCKQRVCDLPHKKIALLGDSATQFLSTAIQGTGVERGYSVEIFESEYNQVERQVLDPTSDWHAFEADYTVIFQSTHKLLEKYSLMSVDKQGGLADGRLDFVRTLCEMSGNSRIIYYNYPEIEDTVFGSYANKVPSSFTYQVRKLNYELMGLSQKYPNLFICDIAGLQNKFGRDFMFDSSVYVSTEMLLSLDVLPYVSSRTWDIICAAEGKVKKCLILDLDNTLWGG